MADLDHVPTHELIAELESRVHALRGSMLYVSKHTPDESRMDGYRADVFWFPDPVAALGLCDLAATRARLEVARGSQLTGQMRGR